MRVTGLLTALILGVTAPAWADLTLTQTTTAKMGGGESTTYIKGHKMRMDSTHGGQKTSLIVDVDAGKLTTLDHQRKEARVVDTATIGQAMQKVSDKDVQVSLKPTATTKQIAGQSCTVYDSTIVTSMAISKDMPLTLNMAGPICLSKTAPGQADFAAFYTAAAEKGFIFDDPRTAQAQPGRAKGFATLYKEMAAAGMPLSTDFTMKIDAPGGAGGMMQAMMEKIAGGSIHSEVTKIDNASVADDLFVVPAGYTVKTQ